MAQLVEDYLVSEFLKERVAFQVILPDGYEQTRDGKIYSVLYLLHGLFGDCRNWLDLTGIFDYVSKSNFATVAFDAGNSWYTDATGDSRKKYESFFIREFIPHIEKSFKLSVERERRAVAGLSMGGYGALKFAVKYPSLFAFAASMSGAFDAPRQAIERPGPDWAILGESITSVFGENARNVVRIENDLFRLISKLSKSEILRLPRIYFACGRGDSFIDVNRELARLCESREIDFQFSESDGQHDWNYWDEQLKEIINRVEKLFRK